MMTIDEYIRGILGRPFLRGSMDCYTITLGWIDAVMGTNYREEVVGLYADLDSGRALLAETGWDMERFLRETVKARLVTASAVGDIAVFNDAGVSCSAIFAAPNAIVAAIPGRVVDIMPPRIIRRPYSVLRLPDGH